MSCIKSIYQNYFIEYLKLFMELYSQASYDYEEKKNLGKKKKNLNRLRRIP